MCLALVPNAEAVLIPKEDLEMIARAIEEEKQIARQRVLLKDLLHTPHEAIETVMHIRGRRAQENPHVGVVVHGLGEAGAALTWFVPLVQSRQSAFRRKGE